MGSFRKASKKNSRLRLALCAPPGGGKTFSALRFATGLGKKICVINTESGAVEKYLGLAPDGIPFEFDIADMTDFAPTRYTQLITEAGAAGYDVIIVDSLSHAWAGSGGALELLDKRGGSNSFTAWKDITPMHNAMIESMLRSPAHIIATMRTKIGYVMEDQVNTTTGAKKTVPRKVGMEPVQRQGMEYEFDIVADLDQMTHTLTVTKSRCPDVDGKVLVKPGLEFIEPVRKWLEEGSAVAADFYVTKPEQLAAVQQQIAEQKQAEEAAAAAEARRQELLAKASGTSGQTEQTEQAPFEANQPATTVDPQQQRLEMLNELVRIGATLGMDAAKINEGCREASGVGVNELSDEKLKVLLSNFRGMVAQAKPGQSAPNSSAA